MGGDQYHQSAIANPQTIHFHCCLAGSHWRGNVGGLLVADASKLEVGQIYEWSAASCCVPTGIVCTRG